MKKNNPESLDQLYSKLEAIVAEFESGEIPLEQALDKFREGVALAKKLKHTLKNVETEIQEIKLSLKEEE